MTIWLDEQFSPKLAIWIAASFDLSCESVLNLPVQRGLDRQIFLEAKRLGVVIMSKDSDFADLVAQFGSPPSIIWVTCGNRSNEELKAILGRGLRTALEMLAKGEPLIELA